MICHSLVLLIWHPPVVCSAVALEGLLDESFQESVLFLGWLFPPDPSFFWLISLVSAICEMVMRS
jgi:hypothetical protein